MNTPILRAPDWEKIFHVHIDASNFAIGCMLAQPGEHNMDFPISYASRHLNNAEKTYTTTEREGLGMVYAVKSLDTTCWQISLCPLLTIKHCCT